MTMFKKVNLNKINLSKAQLAVSLAVSTAKFADSNLVKAYFAKDTKDMDKSNFIFGRIYQIGEKYLLLIIQNDTNIAGGIESDDFIYLLSNFCIFMESYLHSKVYTPLNLTYSIGSEEYNIMEQEIAKTNRNSFESAFSIDDLKKISENDATLRKYCNINNEVISDAIYNDGIKYNLFSLSAFENSKSDSRIYFYYVKHAYTIYLTLTSINKSTSINTIIELSENNEGKFIVTEKNVTEVSDFVNKIEGNSKYNQDLIDNIVMAIIKHIDTFDNTQQIYIDNQSMGLIVHQDSNDVYISTLHDIITTIPEEYDCISTIEKAVEMLPLIDKLRLYSIVYVMADSELKLREYMHNNTLGILDKLV